MFRAYWVLTLCTHLLAYCSLTGFGLSTPRGAEPQEGGDRGTKQHGTQVSVREEVEIDAPAQKRTHAHP
jgi:hypothetical protein